MTRLCHGKYCGFLSVKNNLYYNFLLSIYHTVILFSKHVDHTVDIKQRFVWMYLEQVLCKVWL